MDERKGVGRHDSNPNAVINQVRLKKFNKRVENKGLPLTLIGQHSEV